MFTDRTQGALERALDGVALRQRVAADNVANVMTPELPGQGGGLRGRPGSAPSRPATRSRTRPVRRRHGGAAREDGNTVELEHEMQTLMTSGLQYQALVQATNFKLGLWRSAIQGR